MVALALVISAGGLSRANTGSDCSRYLPPQTRAPSIFWSASLGGMLPAALLAIPGAGITISDSDFNRLYSGFLSLLIVWLSPWLAIYLLDWACAGAAMTRPRW